MGPRYTRCLAALALLVALAPAPALGPLPGGLPPHLLVGLLEQGGRPWSARAQVLTRGWASAGPGPDGTRALQLMRESQAQGLLPVLAFAQLRGEPGGGDAAFYAKTQVVATMRDYFADFRLLMQRAREFGQPVVVIVEPNGFGLLQEQTGADPQAFAAVGSSGLPELAQLPDTVAAWGQAFLRLREATGARNVLLALSVSSWASGQDLLYDAEAAKRPLEPEVDAVVRFLSPLGLRPTASGQSYALLASDPLDLDSDYYRVERRQKTGWSLRDDADERSRSFNRYARWLGLVSQRSGKRWLLWQVPLGSEPGRAAAGHVEYFFGSAGGAHRRRFVDAGVVALLFGRASGTRHEAERTDAALAGAQQLESRAHDFLSGPGLALAGPFAAPERPEPAPAVGGSGPAASEPSREASAAPEEASRAPPSPSAPAGPAPDAGTSRSTPAGEEPETAAAQEAGSSKQAPGAAPEKGSTAAAQRPAPSPAKKGAASSPAASSGSAPSQDTSRATADAQAAGPAQKATGSTQGAASSAAAPPAPAKAAPAPSSPAAAPAAAAQPSSEVAQAAGRAALPPVQAGPSPSQPSPSAAQGTARSEPAQSSASTSKSPSAATQSSASTSKPASAATQPSASTSRPAPATAQASPSTPQPASAASQGTARTEPTQSSTSAPQPSPAVAQETRRSEPSPTQPNASASQPAAAVATATGRAAAPPAPSSPSSSPSTSGPAPAVTQEAGRAALPPAGTSPSATGAQAPREQPPVASAPPALARVESFPPPPGAAAPADLARPTAPRFRAATRAVPTRVAPGALSTLTTTLRNDGAAVEGVEVRLEILNEAGARVAQQAFRGQRFPSGQVAVFTWPWTTPATGGTYAVRVRVSGPNEVPSYLWQERSASVGVGTAAAIAAALPGATGAGAGTGGSGTAATAAAPLAPGDDAPYGFESGTQRWSSAGPGAARPFPSGTEVYAGTRSLGVSFNGAPGTTSVRVASPPVRGGQTVTFHVWIPPASGLDAVQAYVQEGPASRWRYTGTFRPLRDLRVGAWNALSVQVPAGAAVPLLELGVEFRSRNGAHGTAYVDSVRW
ncbi:hypothetical protein FGE12_21400 [Aggregicoccus sp. 17bor-14]|uniref:hypothetical protein n=1 Tax=Myxococcaceae TaxID=31 RepID=UPI00129C58BF|nr:MULTISPECIES: hypothetical protein [Myxococcaceae]MBF5044972.1 hypothetical protein [Simulacricoccus sp. 17bor-14]MRI90715.1 hypothetical protein [Aggregicoccus sp. 17bor-14]